jgi:hypothetical protein
MLTRLRRSLSARPTPFLACWACPSCFSDATHVARRHQLQSGDVCYTVRCGECEAWRDVAMSPSIAARFEQIIADQLALMEVGRERFAAALDVW